MSRNSHLHVEQQRRLQLWGRQLRSMFRNKVPYQVGSSMERADWRDIDVRVMLDDDDWDAVVGAIDPLDLNMLLSAWGREQTGLPIDCQIQRTTQANEEFDGPRNALGLL